MPAGQFEKISRRVPLILSSAPLSDRFTTFQETAHSEYVVAVDSKTITKIVRAHSFNAPEHAHSEAQLSFSARGHRVRFSPIVWSADGAASPLARVRPHSFRTTSHIVYIGEATASSCNMYFSLDFMAKVTERTYSAGSLRSLSYRQESTINTIGQCLSDEFHWSGQLQPEFVDHARFLIATRLLHIMEVASTEASSGLLSVKRLQPAVEFLNEHSESHTSLADLAALCGVSIYHFARSFSAQLGCAPFAYQRALRLEKARELLASRI